MRMRIIFLLVLMFIFFACKDEYSTQKTSSADAESPQQTQPGNPKTTQVIDIDMEAKETYTPPAAGAKESESFKRHFNEKEKTALLKLKQTFETGMCKEQKTDKLKACYAGHAKMIRSDFVNKIPITMSYPYKTNFQLDKTETVLSSIWTNKCGFQTDKEVVNYFCLDAAAKVMDYYKEIAQDNSLIYGFTESYIKNKSLTQDLTTNLLFSTGENLDFDNFDHQLFYTILHLTWNEENKALKKLK